MGQLLNWAGALIKEVIEIVLNVFHTLIFTSTTCPLESQDTGTYGRVWSKKVSSLVKQDQVSEPVEKLDVWSDVPTSTEQPGSYCKPFLIIFEWS